MQKVFFLMLRLWHACPCHVSLLSEVTCKSPTYYSLAGYCMQGLAKILNTWIGIHLRDHFWWCLVWLKTLLKLYSEMWYAHILCVYLPDMGVGPCTSPWGIIVKVGFESKSEQPYSRYSVYPPEWYQAYVVQWYQALHEMLSGWDLGFNPGLVQIQNGKFQQ